MNPEELIAANCGLVVGKVQYIAKPQLFHAYEDDPDEDTGRYLAFPNGFVCWCSRHPHSEGFCRWIRTDSGMGMQ